MAKNSTTFNDIGKELDQIVSQVIEGREEALEEATGYLVQQLVINTPVRSGITRDSWKEELKYKGIKFVFNTSLSPARIPILNLLEYGSKGHPFAVNTFNSCLPSIQSIIERRMKQVK